VYVYIYIYIYGKNNFAKKAKILLDRSENNFVGNNELPKFLIF